MIKIGKELKFKNLVSIKMKKSPEEIQQELMNFGRIMEEKGIKKNGPMINTTYSIENSDGKQIMDIEYLFPVDKKIEGLPEKYEFKEKFYLKNALYTRHKGNPNLLQETYNRLNIYSQDNKLRHITSGYNVFIDEPKSIDDLEKAIIEVYIGIDENIL